MDVAAGRNPARAIGLAWAPVDPGPRRLAVAFEGAERGAAPRRDRGRPQDRRPRPRRPRLRHDRRRRRRHPEPDRLRAPGPGRPLLRPAPPRRRDPRRLRPPDRRPVGARPAACAPAATPASASGRRRRPRTSSRAFSGVVEADAEGRVRAPVALPDFNGTVRLMAVAWTADAVGQATTDWLVRDPVVVQASLPRFLAPGDRTRLRLDLAHATGPAGAVSVALAAPIPASCPRAAASTGTLGENGRLVFDAALAGTTPGDHTLAIETTTPAGERLTKRLTVPVRANDPVLARQTRIELAAGETLTLDAAVLDGLAPGTAHATVALGPLAAFDVPGLLTALEAYPFGCTEQTVSRAMPLLYFSATAEASASPAPPRSGTASTTPSATSSPTSPAPAPSASGTPGRRGDGWLDAYATDFLSRARAQGHAVPDARLPIGARQPRQPRQRLWRLREGRRGPGLRPHGPRPRGACRDRRPPLLRRHPGRGLRHAARAGPARRRAGARRRPAARRRPLPPRRARGARRASPSSSTAATTAVRPRDAAGVLALAAEAGSAAVDRAALAAIVTAPGAERSTQEQLWTLLAAHALAGDAALGDIRIDGAPAPGPALRLAGGGPAAPRCQRRPGADAGRRHRLRRPDPARAGAGQRLSHRAPAPHPRRRARRSRRDRPQRPPRRGRHRHAGARPPGPADRLRPASRRARDREPEPAALRARAASSPGWWPTTRTHAEFRADRFAAAVDWQGAAPFRLAYVVRAVSPGRFHRPAASVEDMYRPAYRARTDAGTVTVRE